MENVVSLRGDPIPRKEPEEALVVELGRLLELAKSGEIVGMSMVYLYQDLLVGSSAAGRVGTYGMVGMAVSVVEQLRRIADGQT